jgi:hypothetical protein
MDAVAIPTCIVPGCENTRPSGRSYCFHHALPADRPSIVCRGCLTRLREPARYCGFCEVDLGLREAA